MQTTYASSGHYAFSGPTSEQRDDITYSYTAPRTPGQSGIRKRHPRDRRRASAEAKRVRLSPSKIENHRCSILYQTNGMEIDFLIRIFFCNANDINVSSRDGDYRLISRVKESSVNPSDSLNLRRRHFICLFIDLYKSNSEVSSPRLGEYAPEQGKYTR